MQGRGGRADRESRAVEVSGKEAQKRADRERAGEVMRGNRKQQ